MPTLEDLKDKRRELGRLIRQAESLSGRNFRQEDIRNRATAASRGKSLSVREVSGQIDLTVKNPRRRSRCKNDLERFLREYCKAAFPLPFSKDHKRLIQTVQDVTSQGGRVVTAMPRSSGKTTICQRAILWACLFSHSRFAVLATADDKSSKKLVEGIRTILEGTPELADDFPEVVRPIQLLEGVALRARYQLFNNEPTRVQFTGQEIRFGFLKTGDTGTKNEWNAGRGNAGAVVSCGGLTSAMRGMVVTDVDGAQRRPDLILVDDPSTRKSAHSPSQNSEREDILGADLAGMSGHTGEMGILCTCTVIEPDDLACRLLDNERHPDWIPIKVPMLYSMPENMDLWDQYDEVRRAEAIFEVDEGSANEFYKKHRKELDKGCIHYWPERIDAGRVSAIQCAMDAYLKDPRAFASEYQNEPEKAVTGDLDPLKSNELVKRQSGYPRGEVPPECVYLTCHIDVQEKILYYSVCGWAENMRGYLVDFGTYPDQKKKFFELANVRKTLQSVDKNNDVDGAIQSGIRELVMMLSSRKYKHGKKTMGITRGLVDARYKSHLVEDGIIMSESTIFQPAYGVGIGAKQPPMSQWAKKPGRMRGDHWTIQTPERRQLRSVFVDTNHWKSELYNSLKVPREHSEALVFFSTKSRQELQMPADHCCAEIAIRVEASNRTVDEWELPPHRPDNHIYDNLVHCLAAASVLGLRRSRNVKRYGKKAKRRYGVSKLDT